MVNINNYIVKMFISTVARHYDKHIKKDNKFGYVPKTLFVDLYFMFK